MQVMRTMTWRHVSFCLAILHTSLLFGFFKNKKYAFDKTLRLGPICLPAWEGNIRIQPKASLLLSFSAHEKNILFLKRSKSENPMKIWLSIEKSYLFSFPQDTKQKLNDFTYWLRKLTNKNVWELNCFFVYFYILLVSRLLKF